MTPLLIINTVNLFQQRYRTLPTMSSESIRNESASEPPQAPVSQTGPPQLPGEQAWAPVTETPLSESDLEERNRYHHFHREWVVRTYGVQAVSLPPQEFFQDPTYPPYLRNIGISLLGMYIQKLIINF